MKDSKTVIRGVNLEQSNSNLRKISGKEEKKNHTNYQYKETKILRKINPRKIDLREHKSEDISEILSKTFSSNLRVRRSDEQSNMNNSINEDKFSTMTNNRRTTTNMNINNKTINTKNPIRQPIKSIIISGPKKEKNESKVEYHINAYNSKRPKKIEQHMEEFKKDEKNKNINDIKLKDIIFIEKIKSKYIFENIFNYIEDKSFKFKLFLYSKKCQKIINIDLIELNKKEKYLEEIGFDLDKYIYIKPQSYENGILTKNYINFLDKIKIPKKKIENIIHYIYQNKIIKDIDEENYDKIMDYGKLIYTDSPLYFLLSQTKNFEKYFTSIANCLKKIHNIKLSSIYYNLDEPDINYLKKWNINNIKRLTLKNEKYYAPKVEKICKYIFSINNIENTLTYLNLDFLISQSTINSNLFEKINNFKSLKYLFIYSFIFSINFTLDLKTLRLLSIYHCENINVSNNCSQNLEILKLYNTKILKKIMNLNKLKILGLINLNKSDIIKELRIMGLEGLKELDLSSNKILDINSLEKVNLSKLEKLNLSNNNISNILVVYRVNFKELKELDLSSNTITKIYYYNNKLGNINIKYY